MRVYRNWGGGKHTRKFGIKALRVLTIAKTENKKRKLKANE